MKKQSGFTLLEVMMVVSIMVILAMIAFQEATLRTEQAQARVLGGQLLKFNNAVRDYVSYYAGSSTYAGKVGTKTGINWLKSTSCGGQIPKDVAAEGFLSCEFLQDTNEVTPFGKLAFSTVITSPSAHILETKTTMSELKLGNKVRGDLAGLAALVAGSASEINFNPVIRTTDGTARFCITEKATQCVGSLGRILLFTSNDASNDTWLRTDGSNTMNNNITFLGGNPDSSREIKNVAHLYNVDGDYLTLGNKTGSLPTFLDTGVVVDSDAEIMGTLYANKMIDRDNSSYYVDPSDESRFNTVKAQSVDVTNNITAGGTITGRQFIDRDDPNYYADPNGESKLHTLTTSQIAGENGKMKLTGQADIDNFQVKLKTGSYVPLLDMLPTYVSMDAYAVQQGQSVPKPTCQSGGVAKIVISPMNMESSDIYSFTYATSSDAATTQVTVGGTTSGRSFMYATSSGDSWIMQAATSNGTANTGYGLAQTFCAY